MYGMEVSIPAYKSVIEVFLRAASFKLPKYQKDPTFDKEVIDKCLAQELPADKMEVIAKLGAAAARWFYPSHDREIQTVIGIFTALAFTVDDLGPAMLEGLQQYRTKLLLREPLNAKLLQSLFDQVLEIGRFYDRFATDMVFKAVAEFCSANLIELEKQGMLKPHQSTPNFTSYFRLKSGVAEPFAYFIFPESRMNGNPCAHLPLIPDLMAFMDETNDIMSFYKESMVSDERDNAIYLHAIANNQSPLESLLDYQRSALGYLDNIRAYINAEPSLKIQVEEFLHGYLAFHFTYPRYRLEELNLSIPTAG
jgi:hypothetical protein